MPVVACPNCSTRMTAPDSAAGKKVRCPKCQAAVPIPAGDEFEVVDEPAPPPKPAKKKPVVVEDDEPPRKKRSRDEADEDNRPRNKRRRDEDDEDEDDRPRKKRRRDDDDEDDEPRQGVSLARNIIMGVVLLVLVAVAGYIFYTKTRESADDAPKGDPKANGNVKP